jgi:hypothetical protein
MIDWSPSEFSRFRLQYNQDKSEQECITDNSGLSPIHLQSRHAWRAQVLTARGERHTN